MQFCQNCEAQARFILIRFFWGLEKKRFVMTKPIPFTHTHYGISKAQEKLRVVMLYIYMEMYCQLQMLHSRFLHFSAPPLQLWCITSLPELNKLIMTEKPKYWWWQIQIMYTRKSFSIKM